VRAAFAPALLVCAVAAWLGALGLGYDPVSDVNPMSASESPSFRHLLGTDRLGRDVWMRLLASTKAFVGPGLAACAVAATLGAIPGVVAGVWGGWSGRVVLLPHAVLGALPRFVLILLVAAIIGHDAWVLAAATGVAYAPALADGLRARVEGMRAVGWVDAAVAHGFGWSRLVVGELLVGACRRLLLVHALRLFSFFVVLETTLAFLGHLGVQEPTPSWGNMIAFSLGHGGNPLGWVAPAVALWGTVAALLGLASSIRSADA
jgi:peptide/nickel transport system permease protein